MPRFNVHLYPTVRVRVDAIDAVDHAAALELARERYYDAPAITSGDPARRRRLRGCRRSHLCGSSYFGSCRIISGAPRISVAILHSGASAVADSTRD